MSAHIKILIAEDSPTQIQQLKYILDQQGYEVAAAANGRLALETARHFKPTLVISDVVMPEMDGYELCRHVKEDAALAGTPVILVTTLSEPEDVIRGLECRADNFIIKPYDERYLLNRVQFVLVNREARLTDHTGMGIDVYFNGQRHFITADRLQILNLLLSTYEVAIQRNRELTQAKDALRQSNSELQQLALELENRVAQRTRDLEHANQTLRETQQTAMQQERLRALGQMASGIAHDINNAISPAALYTASLLEREPGLSAHARQYLETISRAIDDVAATVSRMREFYRRHEPQLILMPVALNELVQQVADLTRARWSDMPQQRGHVIDLKMELAAQLPAIRGIESEIREALVNLIFNAVDALPDGGTLVLRTRAIENDPGNVCIEVADTGIGMDEETKRRCLEPFFTTKGERGTGLGLAMVYGIAQRHGATIEIDSAAGRGTTVRLIFQAATPDETTSVMATLPSRPTRRLHILVVDDDPLIVQSLRDTLEADNHSVVAASSGQAGIDAFHDSIKRKVPFDVVMTDLGMPYTDGRQVADSIKAASPATPIILLTGWGQRFTADGDTPAQVDRVLNKPPKLAELRATLAALTDE